MSSKADDFDVRYRDMRNGRPRNDGADERYANGDYASLESHGVLRSTIDYDLGYDANGWDTQGFRRPEAGYPDSKAAGDVDSQAAGSHARTNDLRTAGPLRREPDAYGSTGSWAPDWPGGPGPRPGPGEFRGPGRQARDRSGTKITRAKVKGSWWRHWTVRKAVGVLLGGIGAFIVLAAIAVAVAYEKTPVPTEAMAATSYVQSVVYSSNGTLIGRFGTTNRQMLSYDQIPKGIVNAVLAAEDRHFWTEGGVSPTGILRAAYEDVTGNDGSLQGGSTITQQFVRNYYQGIGTQQTLSRKIKEIFVAMKVGKEKSKQWILANYLNTIYLGEGAYGIQAAAETYFDKPVAQLSVAQDAVIAAMIQQPSTYPLPQYRPELMARWQYVITGMVRTGTLSAQDAAKAKFPKLGDYVPQTFGKDVWDPYVLNVVKNELTQVYHFSETQLDDGGYIIRTTIDDAKMAALYQAVQQNEVAMAQGGVSLPDYAQVGAVLENPANGAIQAMYPGPGYPGFEYVDHDGGTHEMTARECSILYCEVNMAVYNREQVGSSFKPYVLATAVSRGMNVQTSTLDGYGSPLWIPPDTEQYATSYATTTEPPDARAEGWYPVYNDSASENGPFTPQMAMAESINSAYADLWQHVGGSAVAAMAKLFGVDTDDACITHSCGSVKDNDYVPAMENEAGIALGQASLTVAEQATMLATIDDGGIYHDAHVIASITSLGGVATPVEITSYPVFDPGSSALNSEEATQVQYAMSEDTAPYGTAPTAAMSNGQEIIAKTGTTTNYTSAFFIGAIPSQALAIGIFTDHPEDQSLPSDLGGNSQGGYGGTWPAAIWHTYAENMFVPLGVEQFQPAVFTGQTWNLVPPFLRVVPKPHKNHHGQGPPGQPGGYPTPLPTSSCDPQLVTCSPGLPVTPTPLGGGNTQTATSTASATAIPSAAPTATGTAVGGIFAALPATCLWVRRRTRKQGPKRG